jgi:hypothetical protein
LAPPGRENPGFPGGFSRAFHRYFRAYPALAAADVRRAPWAQRGFPPGARPAPGHMHGFTMHKQRRALRLKDAAREAQFASWT